MSRVTRLDFCINIGYESPLIRFMREKYEDLVKEVYFFERHEKEFIQVGNDSKKLKKLDRIFKKDLRLKMKFIKEKPFYKKWNNMDIDAILDHLQQYHDYFIENGIATVAEEEKE